MLAVGIGEGVPVTDVLGRDAAVSIRTVDELAPALFWLLGRRLGPPPID